jgi:hypothetical protein
MQTVTVRIFDGHFVQPGTEMILRHRFSYEEHDEPPTELLAFDPGKSTARGQHDGLLPQRQLPAGHDRRGVVPAA